MPTTKKRINITVSKSTNNALRDLAKYEEEPVATTAARLLDEALELEEDRYLSQIADTRLKKKAKLISHREVWKHLSK